MAKISATDKQILDMVEDGESLSDAVTVSTPDANERERKNTYRRIYRIMRQEDKKRPGRYCTAGRKNVDDEKVCAEIEKAIEEDRYSTDHVARKMGKSHEKVRNVFKVRAAMLDSESFEDFAENRFNPRLCSADQARAIWLYMFPEDAESEYINDFADGIGFAGELPELEEDEKEMCRNVMLGGAVTRTADMRI